MEFVLAKTHQIHHFLIAFFGVIGVFEVVARFLAVGTGVAVIREIYKFNHIISLVSLIYSEYIHVGLDAGLAYEQINGHFDARQQGVLLQDAAAIIFCFARTCGVLNDDSGVAFFHHRKGAFYEVHSVAGRRIGRIEYEGIGGGNFIPFGKTGFFVKNFLGGFVLKVGTSVTHQKHI